MPLPSLRRKSRPANIARPEAAGNASFPAGEASPVPISGPEPVLTPHMQPRPRSSWYSQASVSYDAPLGYTNPYAPPPIPAHLATSAPTPLTPHALRSLDEAARRAASEEWEDGNVPESPGGTRQSTPEPYLSRSKHTAVSEYLRERAWVPTTPSPAPSHTPPMPTSTPPPVPSLGASMLRRFSLSSSGDRPLSRRDSRRGSARSKRSSITTLPYPVSISEHEHEQLIPPQHAAPVIPLQQHISSSSTQTPSSKFSNPFSFSTTRSKTKSTNATSPAASTPATDPLISTPYEQTKRGRSPIPVTTLHAFDHQVPNHGVANQALIRGLSQKYGPAPQYQPTHTQSAQYPPPSHRNNAIPNRFDSMAVAPTRATAPPTYTTQPAPRTAAQNLLQPKHTGLRVLNTRTRDPTETSDEGSWLYIGTLRGPTPAGVRMIDELMAKSLEKNGTTEKGIKEIRRLLKHESRTTIEWTEGYLRRRWGVGL
ncbi:hypothetical protein OHC33_006126 [Knufia fluminis]|uniref:Uncharacterized protein n=1 Tax=Knufia fluminis TaxID=191047 RepID=A0AAN8EDF0_9EURO|nr:hypothetical protein OHC33_006126 [Knufia fluminis]